MRTFRIENTISGVVLGEYQGKCERDALDAMARDAGYADLADAQRADPAQDGELRVTEVCVWPMTLYVMRRLGPEAKEEDADKVITLAMALWSEQLADGLGEPGEEAAIERLDDWLSNRTYEWTVLLEAAGGNVPALDHVRREAGLPLAC
jgi:hypothetical protein